MAANADVNDTMDDYDVNQYKIGLINLGNTCFMNTSLQILKNVPELRAYIRDNRFMDSIQSDGKLEEIKSKFAKNYELVRGFIKLFKAFMGLKGRSEIDPSSFHVHFQKMCGFGGFNQHDCEEALSLTIDSLHEILGVPIEVNIRGEPVNDMDVLMLEIYQKWKVYNQKKTSIVSKLFSGMFINSLISKDASDKNTLVSTNYEPFFKILLPINGNTLYECFHHYFNTELLESLYDDEERSRKIQAAKQIKFAYLPKYLTVVLKRFENDGRRTTKINTMISFPIEELDVSSYTVGYDRYNSLYRLKSIGCHIGGTNGGHYYAICRFEKDNKWYVFNDGRVSEYDIRSEITELQKMAYILMYERK